MPLTGDQTERTTPSTTLVELPTGTTPQDEGIVANLLATGEIATFDLLVVSYDTAMDDWMQSLVPDLNDPPGQFGFVSVGDRHRSTAAQAPPDVGPSTDDETGPSLGPITPIPDPHDITRIGITVLEYLNRWRDTGRMTVVLFDSVTSLLEWTDTETALQFCHVLRHGITHANNGRGYFFVHPADHSEASMNSLRTTFDDVVEYVGTSYGVATLDGVDDHVMSVLARAPRRAIMEILTFEGSIRLSDLGAHLHDGTADTERTEVEAALYHSHLPKLADAGLVEFDPDAETVTLTVPVKQYRPYLRLARERFDTSQRQ